MLERAPAAHQQLEGVVEIAESLAPASAPEAALHVRRRTAGSRNAPLARAIMLMLPRSVLISPLCARNRKGCASGHVGSVFVL
jgi:hypothetical protein